MADTVFSVINIYFTFINKNKILVFRNWNELSQGQKCQKRMKQKLLRGFTQSPAVVVAPSGQFLQIHWRYSWILSCDMLLKMSFQVVKTRLQSSSSSTVKTVSGKFVPRDHLLRNLQIIFKSEGFKALFKEPGLINGQDGGTVRRALNNN